MDAHQNPYDPMAMSIDSDCLKPHAPVHPAPQDEDKTQAEEKVYLESELWHREGVGWSECTITLHHSKKTKTRVLLLRQQQLVFPLLLVQNYFSVLPGVARRRTKVV